MSFQLPSGLTAAAAAVLLCLPAASSAFTVEGARSTPQVHVAARPDFLAQTLDTFTPPTGHVSPDADNHPASVFARSRAPWRNPASSPAHGGSNPALWNFLNLIHAQQKGQSFDQFETHLAALQISRPSDVAPPSAVPLPGAAWLLVMGVLGLTGTRLTGIKPAPTGSQRTTDRRTAAGPFGAPVPA